MPKTKFQNVVFTLMMSFLMVYAMICYNISMNIGGMTNQVFLMAFHEMIIMWPAAFILEFFLVDHLAHKLAFRMVTPHDRPIVITLAISIMIIAIMCPIMSFIATLLFKNAGKEFVAVWLQTTFLNFPVAFFWQLMYCGYLHPFSVPQTVSGEIRKDIHKGNRFSPLCPQFLWTDGAKWFTFCGYLFVFSQITPAVPDWIR